jgi:hypothetical protein
VWRIGAERPDTSYFAPFSSTKVRDAAIIGGFAKVAVHGDSVAATWSLSDNVYLFTTDGRRLGAVPFGSRYFRAPSTQPPSPTAAPEEHAAWLASFNYASGVWWVTPQPLAVQYFDLKPGEALDRRWHLLLVPIGSERERIEIRDVEVLTVNSANGIFVVSDPSSREPNRWMFARLAACR